MFPEVEYGNISVQEDILQALASLETKQLVDASWGATGTHCWIREFIVNWLPANTAGSGLNCATSVADGRSADFDTCVSNFANESEHLYFSEIVATVRTERPPISPELFANGTYFGMPWFDDINFKNGVDAADGIKSMRCFARHSR